MKILFLCLFSLSTYANATDLLTILDQNCKGADEESCLAMVQEAVAAGENINIIEPEYGFTPLSLSLKFGYGKVAAYLLQMKADHTHVSHFGKMTMLHYAATGGVEELIPTLVGLGLNINAQDADQRTVLGLCTLKYCSPTTLNFLLRKGANIETAGEYTIKRDSYNFTFHYVKNASPLMLALLMNHKGAITLFVNAKANLNTRADFYEVSSGYIFGETYMDSTVPKAQAITLIGAVFYNQMRSPSYQGEMNFQQLLELGLKPSSSDLWFLSKITKIPAYMLSYIQNNGNDFDPNFMMAFGYSIAYHLTLYNTCDVLKILAPRATGLKQLMPNANSLLHILAGTASDNNVTCAFDLLMQKHPELMYEKNKKGNTPFHMAVKTAIEWHDIYQYKKQLMETFLKAGFDRKTTNAEGKTVIQLAEELGDKELAKWIKKYKVQR